jgi:hypothetical protein
VPALCVQSSVAAALVVVAGAHAAPDPGVCGLDPRNGHGLTPVGLFAYPSAAPGSVAGGANDAARIAYRMAENVRLPAGGTITGLCVAGFFSPLGPIGSAPPPDDGLIVTYYAIDPATGLPGAEKARFTPGDAGFRQASRDNEYSFTHPPVVVAPGECFFVSVQYRSDAGDPDRAAYFAWRTVDSPPIGDGRIFGQGVNPGPGVNWQDVTLPAGFSAFGNLSFLLSTGPADNPDSPTPPGGPTCAAAFPRPGNDECAAAETIAGVGTFSFDSRGAQGAIAPTPTFCVGNAPIGRTVWFRWTPACAGTYEWSLCGAGRMFDPVVRVYRGGCDDLADVVACVDDGCPGPFPGLSRATFSAEAGRTYLLALGSYDRTMGASGTFTIARVEGPCDPAAGACCAGSVCSITTAPACTGRFRRFAGAGSACNAPGSNVAPCCRSDFNQDGVRSPADVFAFLTAFFSPVDNPLTDWFNDQIPADTTDVLRFLNAYFEGACP